MKNLKSSNSLLHNVFKFIQKNVNISRPILLALSGGPDSMCLFYLLLECNALLPFPLNLHIAHVNHNWRESSQKEAEILKNLVLSQGLPWHYLALDPNSMHGNLENLCRLERLKFFSSICHEHQCQSIFMGHHENDQSETVFKRIFEGSRLTRLHGLLPIVSIKNSNPDLEIDLIIYRPLLNVKKIEILEWLNQRNIDYFEDPTNLDPKYLRARMRQSIIPHLNQVFGKNAHSSLIRIAQDSYELQQYFNAKSENYLQKIDKGPWGSHLDLTVERPNHLIEIKELISRFCDLEEISLSRTQMAIISNSLLSKVANKSIPIKTGQIEIDRGHLFLVRQSPQLPGKHSLSKGKTHYGDWIFKISQIKHNEIIEYSAASGWKNIWKGYCSLIIALKKSADLEHLSLDHLNQWTKYCHKNTLKKKWNNQNVPAFIRSWVPVIWNEKGEMPTNLFAEQKKISTSQCETFYLLEFTSRLKH